MPGAEVVLFSSHPRTELMSFCLFPGKLVVEKPQRRSVDWVSPSMMSWTDLLPSS